jgi:hypothetical protein
MTTQEPERTKTVLELTLGMHAFTIRQAEKKVRRQVEAMHDRTTAAAVLLLTMADLHAKAAAVYEDALHAVEAS